MSPSTVSRVSNERTYVKPAIREKSLAVVKELESVPNRSFTIGIIVLMEIESDIFFE